MNDYIDNLIIDLYLNENRSIRYRKLINIIIVGRINNVINAHKKGISLLHKIGRPLKATEEVRYRIELETLKNACISALRLSEILQKDFGIQLSEVTINNIRREMKFNWRPPKIIQKLSISQKTIRYQFCNDMIDKSYFTFPIFFSDESRFVQQSDSSLD